MALTHLLPESIDSPLIVDVGFSNPNLVLTFEDGTQLSVSMATWIERFNSHTVNGITVVGPQEPVTRGTDFQFAITGGAVDGAFTMKIDGGAAQNKQLSPQGNAIVVIDQESPLSVGVHSFTFVIGTTQFNRTVAVV